MNQSIVIVEADKDASDESIDGIVGTSTPIGNTIELVRRLASSDVSVLVTGESGTGKELVARALHGLSSRRDQPFVAINCAAIPASLMESELFGHVRGSFTDAKRSRPGLFAQAGSGTVFLDEIGEMPLEMQVKLLRVLQERTVRPIGSDEEVPFRARVVVATNRDLEAEIANRRFREELYFRINIVEIPLPPLRARGNDILTLAQHFLERIAARTGKPVRRITEPVARLLLDHRWPGNVRELENCMERAVALSQSVEITIDDLPEKVQQRLLPSTPDPDDREDLVTLDIMERRYVRRVLDAVGGNKSHAAKVLGINRRSIYRRLGEPFEQLGRTGRGSSGSGSSNLHPNDVEPG